MEDRPPIWKVAANVLNKQSGRHTRIGPPAGGLGEVLTTPHRKKYHVTKCLQEPRTWTDTLVRPKQRKRDMRFGTWNVNSLIGQVRHSQQHPGN